MHTVPLELLIVNNRKKREDGHFVEATLLLYFVERKTFVAQKLIIANPVIHIGVPNMYYRIGNEVRVKLLSRNATNYCALCDRYMIIR